MGIGDAFRYDHSLTARTSPSERYPMGIGDAYWDSIVSEKHGKVGKIPNGNWRHFHEFRNVATIPMSERYPMGIGDSSYSKKG